MKSTVVNQRFILAFSFSFVRAVFQCLSPNQNQSNHTGQSQQTQWTNQNSNKNWHASGDKRGKTVTITFGFPPDWLEKPQPVCSDWSELVAWFILKNNSYLPNVIISHVNTPNDHLNEQKKITMLQQFLGSDRLLWRCVILGIISIISWKPTSGGCSLVYQQICRTLNER